MTQQLENMPITEIEIAYGGEAYADNQIDAKTLGEALTSLSALIEHAEKIINGETAEPKVNIKATKEGSFTLLVAVMGSIKTINALGLVAGGGVAAGGVLGIIEWLKGRKISSIVVDEQKDTAEIEVDGEKVKCSNDIQKLITSPIIRKELDKLITDLQKEEKVPTLLLHSCCAPCSSYVLEYLSNYFKITVLYYNPNIYPESEYSKRIIEQQTLIGAMHTKYPVQFIAGSYEKEKFYAMAKGLEEVKEGGVRCFKCYELRLREAAEIAKAGGYEYFTTTLSISPLKNAAKLNEIGLKLAEEYGVAYLTSDFKKKNGYKRSVELSAQYGLYRQDYCGCEFSMRQRLEEQQAKKNSENA